MDPRLRTPSDRKAKLTKEQKIKQIEEFTKELEEIREKIKQTTDTNLKQELHKQVMNITSKIHKVQLSLEEFYPDNPINLRKMMKRKKEKNFQEFKAEVAEKINYLISIGAVKKAKVMQEQLYFAELHYKYSMA